MSDRPLGPLALTVATIAAVVAVVLVFVVGVPYVSGGLGAGDADPRDSHPDGVHSVLVVTHGNASAFVEVDVTQPNGFEAHWQRTLDPGSQWNVTTDSAPGDYTVTVTVDEDTTLTESFELPLGQDCADSFTELRLGDGAPSLTTYHEDVACG